MRYLSDDGKVFDTQKECAEHEETIRRKQEEERRKREEERARKDE